MAPTVEATAVHCSTPTNQQRQLRNH